MIKGAIKKIVGDQNLQRLYYANKISSFNNSNKYSYYFKVNNYVTYTELVKAIHYISSRVVKRCYRDSNGKPIFNKIDYFKTSFEENKEKFRNMPDEIYPEFDELEK